MKIESKVPDQYSHVPRCTDQSVLVEESSAGDNVLMAAKDILGLGSLVVPEPDAVVRAPRRQSHRILRYIQSSDAHRVPLEKARNFVLILVERNFRDCLVLSADQNSVLFSRDFLQCFANVHDVRDLSISFWGDLVRSLLVGISEGSFW